MLSLERLLEGLDVTVAPFELCPLDAGARLDVAPAADALLHYALAGTGSLRFANGETQALAANSVVIVPPRCRHALEVVPLESAAPRQGVRCVTARGFDGPGAEPRQGLLLACSRLGATYRQSGSLFRYLDRPLVQSLDRDDPLVNALASLLAEQRRPGAGAGMLVRALMQQVLVLILRRYCESGECRLPWLSALEDPRLGRALTAIFERSAEPHSLESLAAIAGMSRSSFAAHFHAAFDRSPMDLLREVRLRLAAQLLLTSELPVKAMAVRVGYDSRSHFSRAFKQFFGCAPAEYRSRPRRPSEPVVQSPAVEARRGIKTV